MRVVVDISGGDLSGVDGPVSVADGLLEDIAVRQFSADGFHIARVIVGFAHDVPYDVQAIGNAVVVSTGAATGASLTRAPPPPVAPSDRAAAERLDGARHEAEQARLRAEAERRAADEAAARAKQQQAEAHRVASEAERLAEQARQ